MRQVLPGIHAWSQFDLARQVDFNGWHLRCGDLALLVDRETLARLEGRPA